MKKQRREFLQQSAAATLGFFIVPRFVIGGKGYTAPSDMINLGFIGTGKQARGLLNSFKDKANIIAGADVDLNKLHYFHSLASKYYIQARAEGKISGYKGFTAPMQVNMCIAKSHWRTVLKKEGPWSMQHEKIK
ncbi:MAG: hypothetical protein LW706_13485 [Chitinophagaceae bacterium]|nr:hypothetical protein [Chitinophagaceae bacterium]